jgi:hypothetical protein
MIKKVIFAITLLSSNIIALDNDIEFSFAGIENGEIMVIAINKVDRELKVSYINSAVPQILLYSVRDKTMIPFSDGFPLVNYTFSTAIVKPYGWVKFGVPVSDISRYYDAVPEIVEVRIRLDSRNNSWMKGDFKTEPWVPVANIMVKSTDIFTNK